MPIGSLKADFTNIPPGTKLTVGSILFSMLDLPEETAAAEANPGAAPVAGEQTKSAAKQSPDSSYASGTAPASGSVAIAGGSEAEAGAAGSGEGDSFSRIEMRVGRITKVSEENRKKQPPHSFSRDQVGSTYPRTRGSIW